MPTVSGPAVVAFSPPQRRPMPLPSSLWHILPFVTSSPSHEVQPDSDYRDPAPIEEAKITVMLLILVGSFVAVSFPAISNAGFIKIPNLLFFIGKHFGTGVILATAFIHLLPDSFAALLSPAVKERYGDVGQWTGLIILCSLLAIFLVEYISTTYVDHLHSKPSAPPTPTSTPSIYTAPLPVPVSASPSFLLQEPTPILPFLANSPKIMRLRSQNSCVCHKVVCICVHPQETPIVGSDSNNGVNEVQIDGPHHLNHNHHHHEHRHEHHHEERQVGRRRQIVGIFVLQVGIMIHSLVIGLTLSVTTGADFASLTTAVLFHQIFEGLSLGIRIAALPPAQEYHHNSDEESTNTPHQSLHGGRTSNLPQVQQSTTTNKSGRPNLTLGTEAFQPPSLPASSDDQIPVLHLVEEATENMPLMKANNVPKPSSRSRSHSPTGAVDANPSRAEAGKRPKLRLEWRGWGSLFGRREHHHHHSDHHHHHHHHHHPHHSHSNDLLHHPRSSCQHPLEHSHSTSSSVLNGGTYGSTTGSSRTNVEHDAMEEQAGGRSWHSRLNPLKTVLSVLFAVTTPAGMALGLLLWKKHDQSDEGPLNLIQGVMSAVSAGMLVYVATVEMIAGDFVFGDVEGGHHHHHGHHHSHEHEHEEGPGQIKAGTKEGEGVHEHQASMGKKALAVVSMFGGVAAMVLIGLSEGDH
ncbi:Zip-domain-containing protein [Coprinopsis marcescibilis]|uniref:Zip-domain-containing protein n=1 Tax=Coprinopsis marcescibilis TaxID=230819 RepID=A0A5C3K9H0_COPMA|nr:Zip-domain-containing protein [Coprinopsis marcescibilis]